MFSRSLNLCIFPADIDDVLEFFQDEESEVNTDWHFESTRESPKDAYGKFISR
jgi:hypothetical protein